MESQVEGQDGLTLGQLGYCLLTRGAAARALALLEMAPVTVTVADPHGEKTFHAMGSVQHVEWEQPEQVEIVVHGDSWRFVVNLKEEHVFLGSEGLVIVSPSEAAVEISPLHMLPVAGSE